MGTLQRVILATNNPHKIAEIRAILSGVPIALLDATAIADAPDPDESGATLEENAIIKARAFYVAAAMWALADDSGLEIDALGGDPGVRSARYAGTGCSFADNNQKVLDLLEGVPPQRRTARFRCVAALVTGPGQIHVFHGTVEGAITDRPMGAEGFGYDPIFYSPELGCTFAEASAEGKHRVSHRGRAFRAVADYLKPM
jgi:XTP/dITP diphosphohydrolase